MPRPPARGRAGRRSLPPPPPSSTAANEHPDDLDERFFEDDNPYLEPDEARPSETVATRRWMLAAGALGVLAVLGAIVGITVFSGGTDAPPQQVALVTATAPPAAEQTATATPEATPDPA